MIDWIIGIALWALVVAMLVYGIHLEIQHQRAIKLSQQLDDLHKQIRSYIWWLK